MCSSGFSRNISHIEVANKESMGNSTHFSFCLFALFFFLSFFFSFLLSSLFILLSLILLFLCLHDSVSRMNMALEG